MSRQKYKQWLHRMCRLYGFRATAPTKVECTLVHAQNALMVQSRQDMAGLSNDHGWGVATYEDHFPHVAKMAWAAYQGEQFRRAAARVHSRCVMAHVRRATIGPPTLVNTPPLYSRRVGLCAQWHGSELRSCPPQHARRHGIRAP